MVARLGSFGQPSRTQASAYRIALGGQVFTMGLIRTWLARRTPGTRLAVAATAVAVLAVSGYRAYCVVVAASHFRAAETAAAGDDLRSARRHLTACLAVWPEDGEVNFQMARAALRDGEYGTAAILEGPAPVEARALLCARQPLAHANRV